MTGITEDVWDVAKHITLLCRHRLYSLIGPSPAESRTQVRYLSRVPRAVS
jgi:hypothetical protein